MAKEAAAPLIVDRQQPSSNEECINIRFKQIICFLILPFIVLVLDAFTIYNFSSISNTMLQIYAVFHMVKILILIILCALIVYAVINHPEKRDIFCVSGIITSFLCFTGFVYFLYIKYQCDSMGKCNECLDEGMEKCYNEKCPDYNPLISKQCNSSIGFPIFGAIAMLILPFIISIGHCMD